MHADCRPHNQEYSNATFRFVLAVSQFLLYSRRLGQRQRESESHIKYTCPHRSGLCKMQSAGLMQVLNGRQRDSNNNTWKRVRTPNSSIYHSEIQTWFHYSITPFKTTPYFSIHLLLPPPDPPFKDSLKSLLLVQIRFIVYKMHLHPFNIEKDPLKFKGE
jgi:hypothetical protein